MPVLTFVMADGQKLEAAYERPPFPDLCAFERQFKMSSAALDLASAAARQLTGPDGNIDPSKLGDAHPEALPKGEWMAFFGWRHLRRQGQSVSAVFEVFLDQIEELDIAASPDPSPIEDGSLDPTEADQPSGS